MEHIAIGAGCVVVGAAAYVSGLMATTVPCGHEAVVLWMGKFSHIVGPGTHFLKWPLESVLTFHTQYKEECGNRIVRRDKSFWAVPRTTQVFDVVPIHATSSDRIKVSINLVFHFRFTDTQKLLQLGDYGNMLENITVSAIRTYANQCTAREIKNGGVEKVAQFVDKYTNENMVDMGLQITQTLVQEINIDADHDKEINRVEKEVRLAEMNAEHTEVITKARVNKRKLELDAVRQSDMLEVENKKQRMLAETAAKGEQAKADLEVQKTLLEYAKIKSEISLTEQLAQTEFLATLKKAGTLDAHVTITRSQAVAAAMAKMNPRLVAADVNALMGAAVMDKLVPAQTMSDHHVIVEQ